MVVIRVVMFFPRLYFQCVCVCNFYPDCSAFLLLLNASLQWITIPEDDASCVWLCSRSAFKTDIFDASQWSLSLFEGFK